MRVAAATGSALCMIAFPAMAQDAGMFGESLPELSVRAKDAVAEWPFSVAEGTLTCVELDGQKFVVFSEPWRDDVAQEYGNMTLPRSVIVSVNPFALLASIEDRELYLPFDSLETLIRRLAPYEAMGRELCEGQEI